MQQSLLPILLLALEALLVTNSETVKYTVEQLCRDVVSLLCVIVCSLVCKLQLELVQHYAMVVCCYLHDTLQQSL
jgi:hypothetical protein